MSRLNFSSNLFIGNNEFRRLNQFLSEDGYLNRFLLNSEKFGVVKLNSDSTFDNFKISVGSNTGTFRLPNDSFAVNNLGELIVKPTQDNIEIPAADTFYWARIKYQEETFEEGTVTISANGTLTGIGTNFLRTLRGGKYFASKIKFESSLNTQEFLVTEVIDDNNALLSGEFQSENNIRYSVVGTFTPDANPTTQEKFPFRYDSCVLELIPETTLNTPPTSIEGEEFFISRISKTTGGAVKIEDKRSLNIYQTKEGLSLADIAKETNPSAGVEATKFKNNNNTKDSNLIDFSWGVRSQNWTFDSSLNRVTLVGCIGGRFKGTSDFSAGDFDGWRIYFKDGSFATIVESTISSSQINLFLDTLDPDKLNDDTNQKLFITPSVEEVIVRARSVGDQPQDEIQFNFPVNTPLAHLELPVFGEPTCQYTLDIKYKVFSEYSDWISILDDTVGYYDESSFAADGTLKPQEIDRNRVTVSNGIVTLTLAATSYTVKIRALTTGDRFGFRRYELDNTNPILELIVGEDFNTQLIEGTITLSTDHYINLSDLNASAGNKFDLIFHANVTLNGFTLKLVENFVNTGDVGTVLVDFGASLLSASTAKNLIVRCEFDGTNWVTNVFLSQGEISIPDGSITTVKLANTAVTSTKLADGSVTNAKLGLEAVSAAKIGTGQVTTIKIAGGAVDNTKLADGAVTEAKIQDDAVRSAQIQNGSVTTPKIADSAVTVIKIATGAVEASKIATGSVGTVKLADGAVTEAKIANSSVTTEKIENLSITSVKITNLAVNNGKLASDSIKTRNIVNGNVTQEKLDQGTWTTPTVNSGWLATNSLGYKPIEYRVNALGQTEFRGYIGRSTSSPGSNPAFNLPANAEPSGGTRYFAAVADSGAYMQVKIEGNGDVSLFEGTSITGGHLDGVIYTV